MISGISGGYYGNNSIYNYQSSLNQLKFAQAIQKYSKTSSTSNSNNSVNSALANSGTSSFLQSYQSTMTNLMSAANTLRDVNSAGAVNQLSVSSSDKDIVSVKNNYTLRSQGSYEIDVKQLAKKQVNISDALDSRAAATSDISMNITSAQVGSASINISAIDSNGNQKTNRQMLADAAEEINNSGLAVRASVVQENGKSSLKIESLREGELNSFEVSGDFADRGGMSNVTQAAQNAEYSVTENGITTNYSQQTNEVSLQNGNITANLKKEGNVTVSVGVDNNKIVSAMENLVKSYNNAISLLGSNSDRGTGVSNQLDRLTSALGSNQSLEYMGLSIDKNGSLVLDKEKLLQNLENDPEYTKDLLSGSFGIAQSLYSRSENALNTSVNSLVNTDIKTAQQQSWNDPISYLNNFVRSGAYNAMNYYAVGMMVDMFA